MTSQRKPLSVLLGAGPLPPRAALDLAVGVVERMAGHGPQGPEALRADRVVLLAGGAVDLDKKVPATEAEARVALGALLYHALVGSAWVPDAGARARQLEELQGGLSFWPDGSSLGALVADLLDPAASKGLQQVRAKCDALRPRAAGADLAGWREEALIRLEGDDPKPLAPQVMNVDDLTANIPLGKMVEIRQAMNDMARAEPAPPPAAIKSTPATPARKTAPAAAKKGGMPWVPVAMAVTTVVLLVIVAGLLIAVLMT